MLAPEPDALTSARWALEGASGFWAWVLRIATLAVVAGVVAEIVATAIEVIDEIRAGHKIKLHHLLTFVGGAAVVIGVAIEFEAELSGAQIETALRGNNATAQAALTNKANHATQQAVDIAKKEGGLDSLVRTKVAEIDADTNALNNKTSDLDKAKRDAQMAATSTKKDLAAMQTLLSAEAALRAKIERLTGRILSEEKIAEIAKGLGSHPINGVLIIPVGSDPGAVALATQIEEIIDRWKKNEGSMTPLPPAFDPSFPSKGVTVMYFRGNDAGHEFAVGLARLLEASDIGSRVGTNETGKPPVDPKTANGPQFASITIFVGSEP